MGVATRLGWAELFKAVFKLSSNPMILFGPDHVAIDINQACVETFGHTREEVVGQPPEPMVASSSRRRLAAIWSVLDRGGRVTSELDWIRGDGSIARVQFAALSATPEGRRVMLCVVLDVRLRPLEQREAEAEDAAASLTPRELEIISQIAMGKRAHEIAESLVISPTTVRTHVRNAMSKLGARSQAQLVAIVVSEGLVDPRHVPLAA